MLGKERFTAQLEEGCALFLMERVERFIRRFTVFEILLIALLSAAGIASKPIVGALARLLAGPFSLPGGTIVGGIYMIPIVMACHLVGKRGTASLAGVIQALIATITGMGSHGGLNLLSYGLPVLLMEAVYLVLRSYARTDLSAALGAAVANGSGVVLSSFIFFRIPWLPLLLAAGIGAVSGAVGGILGVRLARGSRVLFQTEQ